MRLPETRQFVINLLLEVAQHPVDGICILYNRRPPLVDYEPPLVDGFLEAYGEDPRSLQTMTALAGLPEYGADGVSPGAAGSA